MRSVSNTVRWLLLAFVAVILSWMMFSIFYKTNMEFESNRFQKEFNELENRQKDFKNSLKTIIENNSTEQLWKNEEIQKSNFKVLIYDHDSLIFWNNNVLNFNQSYAGSNSYFVANFSNGYYLVDKFKIHDLQVYVASLIKSRFYYQNDALKDAISSNFSTTNEIEIRDSPTPTTSPIVSLDKTELFHITILKGKKIGKYQQLLIFGLYALGILFVLIALTLFFMNLANRKSYLIFLYPILILGFRYLSIRYSWIQLFDEFEMFQPSLYANSEWIPNLGSLIISLMFVFIVVWWCVEFIKNINNKTWKGTILLIVLYAGLMTYSQFVSHTFESLIVNSSIPLVIDEVFSLTLYSFISLFLIAFLFGSYYFLIRQISIQLINSKIQLTHLALIWFFSSIIFLGLEFFVMEHSSFHATWPIILNALFFYLAYKEYRLSELKYNIFIVIVFSFYGAISLFDNNRLNEHQKRILYANQLVTDQDPTMEIEYLETTQRLVNNPEFYQLIDGADYFSAPNFLLQLDNCCFGSFWERYEIDFFFFYEDGSPFFEYLSGQIRTKESFHDIINKHTTASEIAPDLYFVKDYFDQISYIGHRKINTLDGEELDMFLLFKSKKIPESIGFPRLLMNEKSYALQDLEEYSIARYSDNRLVMKFGNFNYPLNMDNFKDKIDEKPSFETNNGISHLVYKLPNGQGVVVSKPEKRLIGQFSTFSYLFLFFGLFSGMVFLILNREKIFPIKTLQLTVKVHFVLIGMVILTFLVFAIVAIRNVNQQYKVNTEESLKDKINSITTVIAQRVGDNESLRPSVHGDYLNYLLKRLSGVFEADINFYTRDGKLFATSQTKIYDKGISTRVMNSIAFREMNYSHNSEFIHHERFGKLSFLSGYVPFTNSDGNLLGYINLQHFSKQNTFEKQVNEFIVSVINIAVLLLVISVLLAIIVSGWITTPLRLLQQSFSEVEFGKENKPIDYQSDDEIGALVKNYNNKLIELELTAMQLAKSERETAWREMAKQIAHEIKNPLTPMKLSVQHFQRSFDPNDPRSKEKMQRLVNSLIEQIDALTNIANEFSNFAKMPKANEEHIDLVALLQSIKELYSSDDIFINVIVPESSIEIFADKDLMLRVFNNLVKNAIQARIDDTDVKIDIEVKLKEKTLLISVKDNGAGIPEEIRNKMFVPNFTTKSTGSGLGLAMVKQIINTHHGDIWFESELGKGTTFFVELPKVKD